MRKRRGRQGRSNASRNAAAAALGLASLVVLAAILVVAPWRQNDYDPDSFCPYDGDYARTAILVDASDTLNDKQIKEILDNLADLRRTLKVYEWVGIFVLDEGSHDQLPKPVVGLCNPGSAATANPLYQNPERIRQRYNERFARPVRAAVDGLAGLRPQKTSPILEMIQAVALARQFDSTRPRRLIIVSDMLQNVKGYSHYRNSLDYVAWSEQSKYAKEFTDSTLLRGVTVEIIYVKREEAKRVQTRRHVRFWEDYFAAVGANLVSVTPV